MAAYNLARLVMKLGCLPCFALATWAKRQRQKATGTLEVLAGLPVLLALKPQGLLAPPLVYTTLAQLHRFPGLKRRQTPLF